MAQHDQVIENASGINFRTDINEALAALFSSNSGPIEPTTKNAGLLWFDTSDPLEAKLWARDINNATWVPIAFGSLASFSRKTAQRFNRVVNPMGRISQEVGDTGSVTSGTYFCDQWFVGVAGLGSQGAARRINTVPTKNGTRYGMLVTFNTAKPTLAAGDVQYIHQPIEYINTLDFNWGTADGKRAILRFTVRCPVAGTYTVAIRNSDSALFSYIAPYTISAAEVGQLVTREIIIPAPTVGVWDSGINAASIRIIFTFVCGTTYHGTPNQWQAGNLLGVAGMANASSIVGAAFVTEVGLYLDPDNIGIAPPWEPPDYIADQLACQRYWEPGSAAMDAYGAAGAALSSSAFFKVPKRVAPTVTPNFSGGQNMSGGTADFITPNSCRLYRLVTATGAAAWVSNWTANARMT